MKLSKLALKVFLRVYANEVVRIVYRGLLAREVDAAGLDTYSKSLESSVDLAGLLKEISNSDEHWKKSLNARAPELVHAVYRGLLGREPDPKGLQKYSRDLAKGGQLSTVLTDIIESVEFSKVHERKQRRKLVDPSISYDKETVVFLHIQKTAGTSMQNMLVDTYGKQTLYREHADTLYQYSPAELSAYSAFAGHFNYDSLAYIPRRQLSTFTFVREPKKRLISLYYFWRSHEPSHASYHIGMKYANELTFESFLEIDEIKFSPDMWNHMTWAIMGQRQWKAWQTMLSKSSDEAGLADNILKSARPAIRGRLREFIFVGLQEDFDRAVRILFQILQRPRPENIRANHSLELLAQTDPHFKRNVVKQPMTPRLDSALDGLVQLDNIVYEEAREMYLQCLAEYPDIGASAQIDLS